VVGGVSPGNRSTMGPQQGKLKQAVGRVSHKAKPGIGLFKMSLKQAIHYTA